MELSGWGRYPRLKTSLLRARGGAEIRHAVAQNPSLIARGMGRAYGDPALNRTAILSLLPSDRILSFDKSTGLLECEAGLVLADLLEIFVPRGWFVPVTPGTKYVSIGGMIAADVHGKNHHKVGSFSQHVESLRVALADGKIVACSPSENPELFAATCGGMGLTGVIVSACFRLQSIETAYVQQKTIRAKNLDEAMQIFEAAKDATYSVAWIDGLARGDHLGCSLIYLGEHARRDDIKVSGDLLNPPPRKARSIPIDCPSFTLNRWSVSAFNRIYYAKSSEGNSVVDLETFFYPLDAWREWNRIYGRPGFVQYQCVVPLAASAVGLKTLLGRIAASGTAPFLAVLKLLGNSYNMMSFPMEGYTLALDFSANETVFALFDELDAIVHDYGGRLYLAKDARMRATTLRRGYPRLEEFLDFRLRIDPDHKFSSLQSERLGL